MSDFKTAAARAEIRGAIAFIDADSRILPMLDYMDELERENAALREALQEARNAVAALTVEVRTIAPTSPHAALLARLDTALQPHAGDNGHGI